MPNYFARANGNINATNVWATTPTGTPAAQTFVAGDVLYANSFSITVNVSTNLGSTGEVRTDNTNGASNGGTFILSNGVTLTANVFTVGGGYGGALSCVTFSGTTGNSASLVGNVIGGGSTSCFGANNTSSGTLNITGNCTGFSGTGTEAVRNSSTGTVNIVGNCLGTVVQPGSSAAVNFSTGTINITGNVVGGVPALYSVVVNNSSGTINITGNCTGGTATAGAAGSSNGVNNNSTGTINITGNCTGGVNASTNDGARNSSTGILSIVGNCYGAPTGDGSGARNLSTGQMSVSGSIFASEFAPGVGGGPRGQVTRLTGPFYTSPTFGVNPNTCLAWRWAATLNPNTFIEVPTTNLTSLRNFVTPDNATNFPAASNVRSGVTYGIGGALVGTCAVPPASSVRSGVPVDNTVGTAALTAANLWDYALSSASSVAGSVGEKLKKTAIPADIIALG